MDCVEETVIKTRLKTAISILGAIVLAVVFSVTAWITIGNRLGAVETVATETVERLDALEKRERAKEIRDVQLSIDVKYIKQAVDELKTDLKELN